METQSFDQYQYKTLPLETRILEETRLNEMGSQGWLLVATVPHLRIPIKPFTDSKVIRSLIPKLTEQIYAGALCEATTAND